MAKTNSQDPREVRRLQKQVIYLRNQLGGALLVHERLNGDAAAQAAAERACQAIRAELAELGDPEPQAPCADANHVRQGAARAYEAVRGSRAAKVGGDAMGRIVETLDALGHPAAAGLNAQHAM